MPQMPVYQARLEARAATLDERTRAVNHLISLSMNTSDHWLAFNYIDAARVVWGKDHDSDFEDMAVHALRRARAMQDAWSKARRDDNDAEIMNRVRLS